MTEEKVKWDCGIAVEEWFNQQITHLNKCLEIGGIRETDVKEIEKMIAELEILKKKWVK